VPVSEGLEKAATEVVLIEVEGEADPPSAEEESDEPPLSHATSFSEFYVIDKDEENRLK
jgi:hypothetical protein